MPQPLYHDRDQDIVIQVEPSWSDEAMVLLDNAVWGTSGLRYSHQDSAGELAEMKGAVPLGLRVGGKLAGVYTVWPKRVDVGGETIDALLRSLLVVDPEFGGKGLGRLLSEQTRRYYLTDAVGPNMLYGLIELDNERSMKIAQGVGYESIGVLHGVTFSRFNPAASDRLQPAEDGDEIEVLLREHYRDHVMQDFDVSLLPDRYWVLREDGEIVAGAQLSRRRWTIVELPGLMGSFMLSTLCHLPPFSRFLPGKVFEYLLVSNLYAATGREAALIELLEGLLAQSGLHAAVFFADENCPHYGALRLHGALGPIDALLGPSNAQVMAGLHEGLAEDAVAELRRRPLYMSPLDAI